MNYSRAVRKAQIKREVYRHFKRTKGQPVECFKIARRIGMVSATNLKNMCRELANEDDNIMLAHVNGVLSLKWCPMEQQPLPERFFTINGVKRTMAAWVGDAREFGGSLS